MNSVVLLFFWIIGITCITFIGSWYARRYQRPDLLIALYVTFILIAQILAVKVSAFDLGFKTFFVPSGVLVFSVTFLITDIVNEKFGRKATHRMILIAFITQVAMVAFLWLGTKLTPAPFWGLQPAWEDIFGVVPRITLASWIAFLVSENADAFVFDWFKKITKGRQLWMRNVISTIPALLLDTLIFIPIAFGGQMPLWTLIVGQTTLKWLVGVVNIPFMYFNRWIFNKNEDQKMTEISEVMETVEGK
ncbi:MAG: queuosine precursor transporter [Patescibacteria group bacterium]